MADITLLKSSVLVPAGSEDMAAFEKALGKLNAKATKYGLPPVTAGEPVRERFARRYERNDDGNVERMYVVPLGEDGELKESDQVLFLNRIALEYPIIALGPWKVLGRIEPFGEGRITFAATDVESELQQLGMYRESEPCCEHCNTKRRRKDTYVVRHAQTGETRQIGSSCLEDFTGIDPAKVLFLAQMYAAFKDMDDDYEHFLGGVGGDHHVRPVDYLRDVLFVTEWQGGFVSSKRAKEQLLRPTYWMAKDLDDILYGGRRDDALIERYQGSRERLLASAQRVIDWWTQFEPSSEFERTAQQIVTAESMPCENKYLAIAAASVSTMDRALAKAMAQDARGAHPSEHVGTAGEKRHQPMRVTGHFGFDSQFGWSYFVNFIDAEGNKYSWKTASPPREFSEADAKTKWFVGKFKIKGHDEYRDEKITTITHVKFEGWTVAPVLHDAVAAIAGAPEAVAARRLVVDVPTITQAFDDMGWRQQVDMLLRDAVQQLRDPRHDVLTPIALLDANGNEVGSVTFPAVCPAPPSDGHLQIVLEPGTRDAWVEAMEESARHVAKLSPMSESRVSLSRDGRYREVGTVHWEALLACEAHQDQVEANLCVP